MGTELVSRSTESAEVRLPLLGQLLNAGVFLALAWALALALAAVSSLNEPLSSGQANPEKAAAASASQQADPAIETTEAIVDTQGASVQEDVQVTSVASTVSLDDTPVLVDARKALALRRSAAAAPEARAPEPPPSDDASDPWLALFERISR